MEIWFSEKTKGSIVSFNFNRVIHSLMMRNHHFLNTKILIVLTK